MSLPQMLDSGNTSEAMYIKACFNVMPVLFSPSYVRNKSFFFAGSNKVG